MLRKISFLLLLLTGIIPVSCCPEAGEGPYLLQLREVHLLSKAYLTPDLPSGGGYFVSEGDTYTEDTLALSLNFSYSLAQNSHNLSLQPSAFALSCYDYPSLKELNNKIKTISITSNKSFNDVPAGEPLNDKVIAFSEDYSHPVNLEQFIQFVNSMSGNDFFENRAHSTLAISEKPANTEHRTFTVTIAYENGDQEVAESFSIIW